MPLLSPPWSGLARIAPRLDLWPILQRLGGPRAASEAQPTDFVAAGLPVPLAHLLGEPGWSAEGLDAGDSAWPAHLTGVPGGAVALTLRGDSSLLAIAGVAIVGTRCCTAYGQEWATRLAHRVAGAGGVVVSGLARGIDAAAHAASGGRTIAVLGQGLDAPMPAWQARLRDQILDRGGLVVSELPPAAHADAFTFPVRNRIVAALARVIVVVEAGHRSGAKNTVAHALRIGREVMAVPGPLHAEASAGCLDLLEEGATMVRGAEGVLEAAGLATAGRNRSALGSEPHALVLAALDRACHPEELVASTGLPLSAVLVALGELELAGRVARLPGRRYIPRPP